MIEKDVIVVGGGIAGLTVDCGFKYGSLKAVMCFCLKDWNDRYVE